MNAVLTGGTGLIGSGGAGGVWLASIAVTRAMRRGLSIFVSNAVMDR